MKKGKEWLKVEMKEAIEIELSHDFGLKSGKYISLYTLEKLIDQLDEPEKVVTKQDDTIWFEEMAKELGVTFVRLPVIPNYIAKYLEDIKEGGQNFYGAYNKALENKTGSFKQRNWLNSEENLETFANAWRGYTIEQPKLLTVIVKDYDKTIMTKQLPEDEVNKMMEGLE